MIDVLVAAAILAAVALFFGVVLSVAYRYLRVEEDPRIDEVEALLPGNNCGACGEPGCRAMAERLVSRELAPAKCTVMSPDARERVAGYLGVEGGEEAKRVARLQCAGGAGLVRDLATYEGEPSCQAAALVGRSWQACEWGCLGLADCARSCTFHAIHMNERGLPQVDVDRCTACGDCVDACPLDLFVVQPLDWKVLVQCRTPLSGVAARAACAVACDACGRCAADAPQVIKMSKGLPVIDHAQGVETPRSATFRCPTGAIAWVEGAQFEQAGVAGARRGRA